MQISDVKRGMKFVVRKGTPIHSTGKVRSLVAKRDQVIVVHHTLSGIRVTAAEMHYRIRREYTPEQTNEILARNQVTMEQLDAWVNGGDYADMYVRKLVITEPSLVWAGTGGYWKECDFVPENFVSEK